MTSRQLKIVYNLAISHKPLTANEIAKLLGVSSRTVKTEMLTIRAELLSLGAALIAKRNEGYSIDITDAKLFTPFFEQLNMKTTMTDFYVRDDMAWFLFVARKLVSVSDYCKLDDIASELYLSRSSINEIVKYALAFLKSYRLSVESKPRLGIRIVGAEYHVRLAMTELFAVHFHRAILDNTASEYARWVYCDEQQRQAIRHNFLKTLRTGQIKVVDIYTQRMSIYFIIARNRFASGNTITLPQHWVDAIKQFQEYDLSRRIIHNLSESFENYDMSEHEIAFLAIYLLCYRDMAHLESTEAEFHMLYREAVVAADGLLAYLRDTYNMDFCCFDWSKTELISLLIPILARIRFCIEGVTFFRSQLRYEVFLSPLASELAFGMASFLGELYNVTPSVNTIAALGSFVYKVISFVEYDIKPLKLLLVNSDGLSMSALTERRLMRAFGHLIESCTHTELYEIRGMNQQDYSAVLLNTSAFSYNYSLPHAMFHTMTHSGDMGDIYNKILLSAYQIKHLLPSPTIIQVFENVDYVNEQQFIQLLAIKHCKDSRKRLTFIDMLLSRVRNQIQHCAVKIAVLFGLTQLTDTESIELYCLKQHISWGGSEINHILYVCVEWQNMKMVKLIENCLSQLSVNPQQIEAIIRDKNIFEKLIFQYLKYE